MTKTYQVTSFVRLGNLFAATMTRLGMRMGPIQLLTVRGRKSGEPRTTPVAVVELDGERYLVAPYGAVNWVRNLRASGEAILTHGRSSEPIRARELTPQEAAPILKNSLGGGGIFTRGYFTVTAQSPLLDFEREAPQHPVFVIQRVSTVA